MNVCGCGPAWQKPKTNGTCATCGGWLPGQEPGSDAFPSFTQLIGLDDKNEEQR